jgi:predicted peptidase
MHLPHRVQLRLLRLGLILALIPWSGQGRADAGVLPYRYVESPDTLNYLLHLPRSYAATSEPFPLLLFLHGIGQKGDGSADAIHKVAVDGPFRTMREGEWDQRLPLIVIGPQAGGLQPWWRGAEVRRILAHARTTYRVDATRTYLTGISMGGRSVWWLAKNFATEFAAVVPTSAWAGDLRESCERFRHLAVWAFHGAKDPLIGLSAGRKPIEVLAGCAPPLYTPPRFTVLEDAGHGRWDLVYANRHGDTNAGADNVAHSSIYEWMLSYRNDGAEPQLEPDGNE